MQPGVHRVQHFSIKEFVFLHSCRSRPWRCAGAPTHENLEKPQKSGGGGSKRHAGPDVADSTGMSFAALVDRVRLDFVEMPEMELTLPQAVRLWSLGMDDCRFVIDSLVDAGFLAWTPKRTIVRKGRDPLSRRPDDQAANISVLATKRNNKSVWNG
jgi:hypothetical protein